MTKAELETHYAPDRRNTNSYKWDSMISKFGTNHLLPLWVADMDFRAPDCVKEAFQHLIDFGVYGYYVPPASYLDAIVSWEARRHGYHIQPEWLRYTCGVVPGIYWLVNILTAPCDACMILTPSYYPFMEAVQNAGRQLVCSELVNQNGHYTVDIEKFEMDLTKHQVKLFVLCSPHNPTGRVWTPDELRAMLDACKRHGVYVISDEIHQDILMPGHIHHPAATVGNYDDMLVILSAASKTFNIAGLKNSFAIIPNESIRKRFDQYALSIQSTKGGTFGYAAVEAVYNHGEPWLGAVLGIIEENFCFLRNTLSKEAPLAHVTPLEGTYLAWVDLGAYMTSKDLQPFIQECCGLAVDYGSWFFPSGREGDTHIRLNLATPRSNIRRAIEQLVHELKKKVK